ncbi:unnamed protein product [Symbiodinium natans]|uniref:Uncharacterized protein n=1 Tax=Symbiodinium natans TaxID=878477 RepID=A0A812U8I7_9DINO|nr:unnamed protein product [Symbiodinium natans]
MSSLENSSERPDADGSGHVIIETHRGSFDRLGDDFPQNHGSFTEELDAIDEFQVPSPSPFFQDKHDGSEVVSTNSRAREAIWYEPVADAPSECQDDPVHEPAPKARKTMATQCNESSQLPLPVSQALYEEKRKPIMKFPWEQGFGAAVFEGPRHNLQYPFTLSFLGRAESTADLIAHRDGSAGAFEWVVQNQQRAKRLYATRMAKSDDQLRLAALTRLRNIILFEPSDSKLGRSLLEASGCIIPAPKLASILSDVYASKATATLCKRSCDFMRFSVWQVQSNGGRPLAPTEQHLYDYICHLRDQKAAPTAAGAFVSSWRFMHFTAVTNSTDCISPRVEGGAHNCYMEKRPLQQAPALKVWLVKSLEKAVFDGSVIHSIIAGFCLFCLFSCARWSDAAKARSLSIDVSGSVFLIEALMLGHKTAKKQADRRTLMPLIALGHTFSSQPWAEAWLKSRRIAGLEDEHLLMPACDEMAECFLERHMTAAEGGAWLQEILASRHPDFKDIKLYTTHSLKATPLSWATKSNHFTDAEKRVLGHHVGPGEAMPVTYGRDVMAPVLGKLQHLVHQIRQGDFDPDASRASRVAQIAADLTREDAAKALQRFDESEVSDVDLEDHDDLQHQSCLVPASTDGLKEPEVGKYVQHCISSIVHAVSANPATLKCGRPLSQNYYAISYDPLEPRDFILCEQCRGTRSLGESV